MLSNLHICPTSVVRTMPGNPDIEHLYISFLALTIKKKLQPYFHGPAYPCDDQYSAESDLPDTSKWSYCREAPRQKDEVLRITVHEIIFRYYYIKWCIQQAL